MILSEILGQERALAVLRRVLEAGRLGHAYVFDGPPGVGKRATALALARACLCVAAPRAGCGHCTECRLIDAGSHPDVFVEDLARAQIEKPATTHVSIDQVRRMRAHLAMRPLRGPRKLGIVDQAERLTTDAQDALLKTLEEPPGNATLVLVATNADALLPTIRSRCQRLLFAPLENAIIERLLQAEGTAASAAPIAAALADGSLDRARELAAGDAATRYRELLERLDRLPELEVPEVLDLAGELAPPRGEREIRALNVAAVVDWCRRRLRAAVEATRTTDADSADGAIAETRLEVVRHAYRQLERACATSRDLERNANVHLAWDCLLLDLRAGSGAAPVRAGAGH